MIAASDNGRITTTYITWQGLRSATYRKRSAHDLGGLATFKETGRRCETVEHLFGTVKQWTYQGAFLMRGLEKIRAEFSRTALAYNLRRVLNMVGFTEFMAAVAA